MGEAESVSQREFSISTGHVPWLAKRAQLMWHAAMKMEKTAVRSELIAHFDCRFRRKAFDAHAEEECGDTRANECNCLVTTGDVSSFALVTSDFFPAKCTSVLFWSTQCELCNFCLTSVELNSCFFFCCQFFLVTRL